MIEFLTFGQNRIITPAPFLDNIRCVDFLLPITYCLPPSLRINQALKWACFLFADQTVDDEGSAIDYEYEEVRFDQFINRQFFYQTTSF